VGEYVGLTHSPSLHLKSHLFSKASTKQTKKQTKLITVYSRLDQNNIYCLKCYEQQLRQVFSIRFSISSFYLPIPRKLEITAAPDWIQPLTKISDDPTPVKR